MTKLHPDFPDAIDNDRWDWPDPLSDISAAFDAQSGGEQFKFTDLASVDAYHMQSDGDQAWSPEHPDVLATELSIVLLGTLTDGRWFALEAWNDYTGWGCQDGCDIYAGATREDAITNGLTESGREALGLPKLAETHVSERGSRE